MNRRQFLRTGAAATAAASFPLPPSAARDEPLPQRAQKNPRSKVAAYYLRAHMYTCVPRQIREDMEWMAAHGTSYVCTAFLEQDLFAAKENHDAIASEAARVGMQVLTIPSRWGGLVAGAPKVPSLFSMLHPETLAQDENGSTRLSPTTSGGISSVHHPATLEFFCNTLAEVYKQHPSFAGMILDEPKCFRMDYSPMAIAALGKNAPAIAHYNAARDFLSRVCAFAKQHWPDKLTILFQQGYLGDEALGPGSGVDPLDYYGVDGRPWGPEVDETMKGLGPEQESGRGKILLGGKGSKAIALARKSPGRKSFLLIENHNLTASMIDPLDRAYRDVLDLGADMYAYYYYPRNVEDADRAMEVVGRHLLEFASRG